MAWGVYFLYCIWGVSLFSTAAFAATHYAPIVLQPITVLVPKDINDLSTVTLTDEEIQRMHPKNLVDILQSMNGISMTQNGAPGSVSSLFIRGGNPNHTLFISDGLPLNDPSEMAGSFSPSMWSASSVEKVTLSKGVVTAGNAITGVIETELSKGDAKETNISMSYGSFDTKNTLVSTKGSLNRFHYNVKASHFKSQGYCVTPLYLRKNTRHFLTDPSSLQNIHARFDADMHEDLSMTWFTQTQTTKNEYASTFGNPFRVGRSHSHYNIFTINGKKDLTPKVHYAQKILVGFLETKRQDGDAEAPFLDPTFRQRGGRSHTTWQHTLATGPWSVLGEIFYTEDRFKSYTDTTKRRLNLSPKSWMRGFVVAPTLSCALPFRHHIHVKTSLRCDHHHQFKGVKNYTTAVDYTFPSKTTLSIAYGTAYKAPSLFQLFGDSDFSRGNQRLRPEYAHNFQYGVAQSFSNIMKVEVMHFQHRLKNLIQGVNNGTIWTYDNVQRAKISGVESSVTMRFHSLSVPICVKVGHTYLHTQDQLTGRRLLRRPKNMINVHVDYTTDIWDVGALLTYKGGSDDRDPLQSTQHIMGKSHQRVTIFATYHLNRCTEFFARIENALDRRNDQDPLGYQRPGMGVYGGIKMKM